MSKVTQTCDWNPGHLPSELTPLTTKQACLQRTWVSDFKRLTGVLYSFFGAGMVLGNRPAEKEAKKESERRVWLSPQLELCPGLRKKERCVAWMLLGLCRH